MATATPLLAAPTEPHGNPVVDALVAALELRHAGTAEHARRVADLAIVLTLVVEPKIAIELGVRDGYLLHDIGKLATPDAVLLKPEPLNAFERRVVERHPALGERLTRSLRLPEHVHEVVGGHHERWDGKGYPRRIAGPAIPAPARIFAVVDAFDAMTDARPYRAPLTADDALAEIGRNAGTQFDPQVCDAFLTLMTSRDLTAERANAHLSAVSRVAGVADTSATAGIVDALFELATPRGATAMPVTPDEDPGVAVVAAGRRDPSRRIG